MAFEGLSEKLNATFKHLRGKGRLSEEDIKLAMREVRLALLEADVSYKVVKGFVKTVSERAVGAEVLDSLTPAQQVIKIVNEELTALMGGANARLTFANNPPTVVMMVGLQGAGKTTNVAKLAGLLRRQGKRPLLAACDVYRPAAITQLQVVGAQLGLPVFEMGQIDPVTIAVEAVKYAKDHGNDIVFLDTAGIIVDYKGITVAEDTALRAECRKNEVDYAVVKNTLLRFAFNNVGLNELDEQLNGTTALAVASDPVAPARVIADYAKKLNGKFEIKGGFMDGKVVDMATINALAAIPALPVLQAQVLGTMLAPITSLACVLKQIAEKDGAPAEAAEAAAE